MLARMSAPTLSFQGLLICLVLLSCAEDSKAGLTSSFIRKEWPSTDIPLDNEVFAIPKGHNAPQQVHITQGDYDGKSVIVSWITTEIPGPSKVQYGKSKHQYRWSAEGTTTNYTFYQYKSGYIHHCLVDDLEYDTKYYYKIGRGNSARTFWFHTPPKIDPDAAYTFGIIGNLAIWARPIILFQHYMQSKGQAVLFLGDLSYADKYKKNDIGIRWDSWGRFAERSTAYQPWIWIVGNHEIDYKPELGEVLPFKNFMYRYATPFQASNSSDPLWYAIRRASAHIIVLSSYSPFMKYTPQWRWLRGELARVNREKTPWLIVLMHVPLYNSNEGHFMEAESMRVTFESWFVQYRVDFVLSGHVHAYERSYRISNIHYNVSTGYPYPVPDKSAPVYLTIGDGGNLEGLASKFRDPQPEYSAFREAIYGHSTLEIMNRTHALYHWHRNDDGKKVAADSVMFLNQYWGSNLHRRRMRLEKRGLKSLTASY